MAILKLYDGADWIEIPVLDGVPGGELGGTWAVPTVDPTHSGSAHHDEAHAAESHSDQGATGAELETLTDASDADALHAHADHGSTQHHDASHTAVSHSDQGATGAELETLTDGSDADALHAHDLGFVYVNFVIDGGGSEIATGIKGDVELPAGTIKAVTMLADQSGSIVVDLWVDSYDNYPPTDDDSITASAVPTITTAIKSQDSTLTDWTTALSEGGILRYNVDSVTDIERVTISLKVERA